MEQEEKYKVLFFDLIKQYNENGKRWVHYIQVEKDRLMIIDKEDNGHWKYRIEELERPLVSGGKGGADGISGEDMRRQPCRIDRERRPKPLTTAPPPHPGAGKEGE